ncbi:hypothetical protein PEB0150_019350 [Bartonella apis]|nr:hypothetical protein PEB0150_019350 [Bartonella apis]
MSQSVNDLSLESMWLHHVRHRLAGYLLIWHESRGLLLQKAI